MLDDEILDNMCCDNLNNKSPFCMNENKFFYCRKIVYYIFDRNPIISVFKKSIAWVSWYNICKSREEKNFRI